MRSKIESIIRFYISLQVVDPYKASYGIVDHTYAISQLAQTTMRSEIGKITLDKIFQERETLNANIVGKSQTISQQSTTLNSSCNQS